MADILVRDGPSEEWRKGPPPWQGTHSERAKEIAELYNSRDCYDKEYEADLEDWEQE